MDAVVIHAPHDLRIDALAPPPAGPGEGEVVVHMAAGGICGSDLHYYHHGGFGTVRIREPMVLGHEAAGHVEAIGAGVTGLRVGQLVAVNPSQPCLVCPSCKRGERIHCENMRFSGSAMRFPHEQGLFRERITVPAFRAFPVGDTVAPEEAALCEPVSVSLHAARQAGDLAGRRVLVSGCGPIGVIVATVARHRGAAEVICTDIAPHSLEVARAMGCDAAIDVSAGPQALAHLAENRGRIDVAFECSGAPGALAGIVPTLRPKGRMVIVGLGGDVALPMNTVVVKEIEMVGTFRFDDEFGEAAAIIGQRLIDFRPMITAVYPMADAVAAFGLASDRKRATKVAIRLGA
ncbi:MAG: L-idonate 5-dehydrogenase [Burkholderiales bacterium]|nr:L-idonate 5-dehydrogenase [Burkholderiales bacterium]